MRLQSRCVFKLISLNGQVLKQVNAADRTTLSVKEFNAGHYIIRVSDSTGLAYNFKLLITK